MPDNSQRSEEGGEQDKDEESGENKSDRKKQKSSFTEQLREARENSEGFGSFLIKALAIISLTAGCTVLMALFLLFPIFTFFVGLWNLHHCPVNIWIPRYLLILGGVVIFQNICFLTRSCCHEKIITCINCLQLPINLFILVWFVLGNIWVYGKLGQVNTSNSTLHGTDNPYYCNHLCYWLAFWLITLVYMMIVGSILGTVFAVLFLKKCKRGEPEEEIPIISS